jgi:hypothetical protein
MSDKRKLKHIRRRCESQEYISMKNEREKGVG